MVTAKDMARELGIKRLTLNKHLWILRKAKKIKVTKVEDRGHFKVFIYDDKAQEEVAKYLKELPPQGRPLKKRRKK